jgi:lipopolysaccharide export system permease protein
MVTAFLIGIFNVVAFNPFSANMYQRYEMLEDKMQLRGGGGPLQLDERGLWLRESSGNEAIVVHANGVRQQGKSLTMSDVSVYVLDLSDRLVYGVEADEGELINGVFHLQHAHIVRAGQPEEVRDFYDFPTQLTVARIQDNFAMPDTVSFWKLPAFIRFFESAGFSASRHKLHYQYLLASPILLVAMVLVAAVFSLNPDLRSGGLLLRVIGGVTAGFLFYFFQKVVYALGLSSTVPILLAAWTPAIVAGLFGLAMLFHLEDG